MRRILTATALSVAAAMPVWAQSSVGTYTQLERTPIADSEGLELVVALIEQGDASTSPKHMHPRGETVYVLDGVIEVEGEGGMTRVLTQGDSFHQPPGAWHIVRTQKQGAKAIVIRVLGAGEEPTQAVE